MDRKRLVPLSIAGLHLKPGRLHAAEFDEARRERNVLLHRDTTYIKGLKCTIPISSLLPPHLLRFISRNGYGIPTLVPPCSKRLPASVRRTRSWFPGCIGG